MARLAIQMLIDAAEDRGPMLFAKTGIPRAVERHVQHERGIIIRTHSSKKSAPVTAIGADKLATVTSQDDQRGLSVRRRGGRKAWSDAIEGHHEAALGGDVAPCRFSRSTA
jgi:hypothetical protein